VGYAEGIQKLIVGLVSWKGTREFTSYQFHINPIPHMALDVEGTYCFSFGVHR